MTSSKVIYIGVKGSVLALDAATGQQRWAAALKGAGFVNVVFDGGSVLAATQGEVFCLDPQSGAVRWHNPLKGYGFGLVTIAGEGIPQNLTAVDAEKRRRDQQQQSAAGATTGAM